MAYGDILEYNGKKYRCINPNLTSNTTPAPYYANASKEYIYNAATGHGHAFCVFTDPPAGVPETEWSWSPSEPPNWVGLYLGKPEKVDLISIKSDAKKRTITIYGGEDAKKLVGLYTFTHSFEFFVSHYIELPEQAEYGYYQVRTTWVSPSGWSGMADIRFYQLVSEDRYLLKEKEKFKTIVEGILMETARGNIITEGFTDIMKIKDVYEMLDKNFSILRYSPDGANDSIEMGHLPDVQLVKPVGDIDLSSFSNIKQMTFTTTGSEGIVRIVFSFDKGETWNTFIEGAWKEIRLTVEDIMPEGITPEAMALITANQWKRMVAGPLRIAFCISKTSVNDDMAVDRLSIKGDTASWKKAERAVDYNCILPKSDTMVIGIMMDGNYKVNYMEAGVR